MTVLLPTQREEWEPWIDWGLWGLWAGQDFPPGPEESDAELRSLRALRVLWASSQCWERFRIWNRGMNEACAPEDFLFYPLPALSQVPRDPKQHQKEPGGADLHTQDLPSHPHLSCHGSLCPMGSTALCTLVWSCSCWAAREVWAVSLLPGCSWRKWGTCVCWPAGPCQTQCKTKALTLFFLSGLQFGSLPAASFCETHRNHIVLRLLLFFQMKENCWNLLLSGNKPKTISRKLRGQAVRSILLWLPFERGDSFESSKLNLPIQGKPDMNK